MTPSSSAGCRLRRWRAAAIGFTVLLGAALASSALLYYWWHFTGPRPAEHEQAWPATVLVLAGNGVEGVADGDAARARFSDPFGIAVASDGTVYVADAGEAQRIRHITADGTVGTLAGGMRGFADGFGPEARFDTPSGLAMGPDGSLYVADTGNNAIRRVTPDGHVSTVAGDGTPGYRDGPAANARFNGPVGVAVDAAGRVIVADTYNDLIRAIGVDGRVTTLAGGTVPVTEGQSLSSGDSPHDTGTLPSSSAGQPGWADGAPGEARFDTPCGVAVSPDGTIYVADTGNGVIRALDANGHVTTLVMPTIDRLVRPVGIAAAADGALYATDDRGRIIEVVPGAADRVVAGSRPDFRDGDGAEARFRRPAGVAVAGEGRLVVADAGNALLRLVTARSQRPWGPPSSPLIAPRFDAQAFAHQPLLWPVAPMDGPFEVAGTLGEARGSDGGERLHAGVDIRVPEWTPVRAVRGGTVSSPIATGDFASLNEWLRIGPITYVHIRAGRTRRDGLVDTSRFVPTYNEAGRLTRVRVKRGAVFAAGEVIGAVNPFNHVHLNVGWPGEEHNPLRFNLVQFADTVPPTIPRGGIRLFDEVGEQYTERVGGRLVVSGRVQIVVEAWDQAEGNLPHRRLGLYALGYQVLRANGAPAPGFDTMRETIRFDRVARDPDAARLVYAPESGIPFYGRRTTRFLYIVTNTFRSGFASPGHWDTTALEPGDYIVRVKAADFHGNEGIANRDLAVTIVAETPHEEHEAHEEREGK